MLCFVCLYPDLQQVLVVAVTVGAKCEVVCIYGQWKEKFQKGKKERYRGEGVGSGKAASAVEGSSLVNAIFIYTPIFFSLILRSK